LTISSPKHAVHSFLTSLPRTISQAEALLQVQRHEPCRIIRDARLPAEGYHLAITPSGVHIEAADAAGALYACQSLRQIYTQAPEALPLLDLTDRPDLRVRGVMLDISRGRVPLLSELLSFIEALHQLRVNQFQLYIEHTFAWPGHEVVWQKASPLTAEDIHSLDQACRDRGIELVPNLNTFGHLERWLEHEPYRQLAECPNGWVHPLTQQFKPIPSTLRPSQASLDFVAGLLDGYLPHFKSQQVNIGGDEPWELGQGFSRDAVAEKGKHQVYLAHLQKICDLVQARGHVAQFWGDILLEDLTLTHQAPAGAIPVVWGYDAGHPFAEQCGRLASLNRPYLIASGTSTWQSFTGRLNNALSNQSEAIQAALRHQANGLLVTTWGDQGYHQPWPTTWLPTIAGLTQAWCQTANYHPDFAQGCMILGELTAEDATLAVDLLTHLGQLEEKIVFKQRNRSLTWDLLTSSPEVLKSLVSQTSPAELTTALDYLKALSPKLGQLQNHTIHIELSLGVALAEAGIQRALGRSISTSEQQKLSERYQKNWLHRARRGGLEESLQRLWAGVRSEA
jgi:hypothetical protein